MCHWLIVYDRSKSELVHYAKYADPAVALRARFAVEHEHPDLEVVVLGADSLETIKVTHSRYFGDPTPPSTPPPPAGQGTPQSPESPAPR